MQKNPQKMIVIVANPVAVVVNLFFIIKSKAMNKMIQKDTGCCEPGSICCGNDSGTGCC
jgi:hypothetical protein